ncbi:YfbU family protein [Enterobacter asburiae]|uniref:YfbU family protein n=1 Tax=Enterobacter asburiae TaxID=61645 RepID=UPI003D6F5C24
MSYSQAEKLQILMMCDIYEKLGIENSYNPEIIRTAIDTGNYWAIEWAYQDLSTGAPTPPEVTFVCDVLDMFGLLQYTYENLTDIQKEKLLKDVSNFNYKHDVIFSGFDWNNESEYTSITRMFKLLDRFSTQNIVKNSHSPRIAIYQRMLNEFLPIRKDFIHDVGIPYDGFCAILNARVHPSNR